MFCQMCGERHNKREGTKFCSEKCSYQFRTQEKICKNCGDIFVNPIAKTKFCSQNCCKAYFNAKKERKNNPVVTKQCKICGTEFKTNIHKLYCSDDCRTFNLRARAKKDREVGREAFRKSKFKEYTIQEGDTIDFPMKELAMYKYCDVKLKEHMIKYEMPPRQIKKETNTIRGVWRRKISIINVAELIQLYNIKIEKFRNYPHLNVYDSIIGIAKIIDYARRNLNEKL